MSLFKKIIQKISTHKSIIIIGSIIIAVGAIGYLVLSPSPIKYTYITQSVQQGTLINDVTGTGNVEYSQSAAVNSQVSGTVSTIDVSQGQTVSAGETLYNIKNNSLSSQADKLYATYLQDKQTLSNNEVTLTQDQNNLNNINATVSADQQPSASPSQQQALGNELEQQTVATQQLNTDRLAISANQANEYADWQAYSNQLATIAESNVTAPISGIVANINVSPGQYLSGSAGSTAATNNPEMLIVNPASLVINLTLNEVDAAKVQTGQNVQLSFNAINGLNLTGSVTSINPIGTISQGVVTYNVIVTPDILNSELKSGMSVTANITTEVENNVISVPSSAIKTNSSGEYVQILQNNKPINVNVQTGIVTNNGTAITSGLKAGEQIITQIISNKPPKLTNSLPGSSLLKLGGSSFKRGGGRGASGKP